MRESPLDADQNLNPGPNNDSCACCKREQATNSAAFLPSAIARSCLHSFRVILLLFSYRYSQDPPPPPQQLTTSAVVPSRFSAACLHSRQISTPKLRLINCDPSHLSLLSLLSLPPTLAQRPNRLPISYRRARRLGLLQTLALKKTLIHHHRHHQARLLPAIRSPLLLLLRS